MFIFEPTSNLEDFIARHGATLTYLCLEDCPIVTRFMDDIRPYHVPRYQSDIWNHFAERLEVLIDLNVMEFWDDRDLGYLWHGIFSRYLVYATAEVVRDLEEDTLERLQADEIALENFKSVVEARCRGLHL